jgi:hypothetical protein
VLAQDAAQKPVTVDNLDRKAVTRTFFRPEKVTITPVQLIQIRKLFQIVGVQCSPGEEQQKAPYLQARLREGTVPAGGEPPRPAVPNLSSLEELSALHGLAGTLRGLAQGRKADRRPPAGLAPPARSASVRRRSGTRTGITRGGRVISAGRMLLATPDPVPLLKDKAVSLLHGALNHKVEGYNDARDLGLAELEADANWMKLEERQRQALLAEHGLAKAAVAPAATAGAVLEALERTSLDSWVDRIAAIPPRFTQVRVAVAKLLEPKVAAVQIPKRILRSEAELEAWLEEASALLRARLGDDPVVV